VLCASADLIEEVLEQNPDSFSTVVFPLKWDVVMWLAAFGDVASIRALASSARSMGISLKLNVDACGDCALEIAMERAAPEVAEELLYQVATWYREAITEEAVPSLCRVIRNGIRLPALPAFLDSRLQAPMVFDNQEIPSVTAASQAGDDASPFHDAFTECSRTAGSQFPGLHVTDEYRTSLLPLPASARSRLDYFETRCLYIPGLLKRSSAHFMEALLVSGDAQLLSSFCVKSCVAFKWSKYGRRRHRQSLLKSAAYVTLLLIYEGSRTASEALPEWLSTVARASVAVAASAAVLTETRRSFREGLYAYTWTWNFLKCIAHVLIATSIMLPVLTDDDMLPSWTRGLGTCLVWLDLLGKLKALRAIGVYVHMIQETVRDTKWFILVVVIVIVMSGHVLHASDPQPGKDLLTTMIAVVIDAWLGEDTTILDPNEVQIQMVTLEAVWMAVSILAVVYLLNLLIAILLDTYTRVRDGALVALTMERISLLQRYERDMDMDTAMEVFPKYLLVSYPRSVVEHAKQDVSVQQLDARITSVLEQHQQFAQRHDAQMQDIIAALSRLTSQEEMAERGHRTIDL